jgi:hypothetical protein
MGWGTAVGEALRIVTDWLLNPVRKVKKMEEERQEAMGKARDLGYGNDAKKLKDHIDGFPR